MEMFWQKLMSLLTAIFTLINVTLFPQTPEEGVFEEREKKVQTEFDEGEFKMGEYDIVVSVNGDDSNPGTLAQPLKTPAAAKEKLKALRGQNVGAVTVWFREGTYYFDEALEFNSTDLGNVLYRSYPNERIVFSGSKPISGWSKTVINGVDAFVADVPVESEDGYFRSLFKDGRRLSRSNYPKEGAFAVVSTDISDALHVEDYFTNYAAFYANTDEILDFANPTDVDVRLMHYWCDELMPIYSVDTATGRIETTKASSMTVRVNDNFVYENVREALSLPGEWYLDRAEGKLYYIPETGDTVENTVLYAGVTEQLITVNGAQNISFQGINFENTDWQHVSGSWFGKEIDTSNPLYQHIEYGAVHPQAAYETPAAIYITGSKAVNFTDCRFENISYTAVKFDNGTTDCNVTSCLFNEIGANAVYINGPFTVPATTGNINVTDCHISKYGRIFNNAIGIFLTHAVNCDLSNNEIHDGWYTGISVGWNWGYSDNSTNGIKITNNLIYNIGNGWLSDMGGIYTLGIQPDTVISGNVIYNVGCYGGEYGYGGWGIYLDEGSSEILVENNLVYDCSSQCFHQHYGRDNMIRNNIFAFGGEGAFRITRNEEHNSLFLYNNILVSDNAEMYRDTVSKDWFVDSDNLYWDYSRGGNVISGSMSGSRLNIVDMVYRDHYANAVFADPLFKDAQNRDFTLATNSPALGTGFVPFSYNAGTNTLFN